MPYIAITNFKYGLDTRRSQLSSQPGTLLVLNNAHITEGGQIEKRKAFVKTTMPASTYGLQQTSTTIYKFGSKSSTGLSIATVSRAKASTVATLVLNGAHGLVTGNSVTITGVGGTGYNGTFTVTVTAYNTITYTVAAGTETTTADTGGTVTSTAAWGGTIGSMPSGFTYQQLYHPAVLNGTVYTSNYAMTAVIASTLFSNAPFVIAKFADNGVYVYYDGSLVNDYVAGVILGYMSTNGLIAKNIVSQLSLTTGYASSTQVGTTAVLDIIGNVGASYATTQVVTSTTGTLTPTLKNYGLAPISGLQPVGQFSIMAGSNSNGVNYISSVKLNNGAISLLSAAVNYQSTNADTAAAVSNNISANSAVSGYYSVANGNVVSIFPVTAGKSTNGYDLKVTCAGNVCVGNCVLSFSGVSTTGVLSLSVATAPPAVTTTSYSSTTTRATITTATAHSLVVGSRVNVTGCTNTQFNVTGAIVTTVPSTTSFTFDKTLTTTITTVDTGGLVSIPASNIILVGGPVVATATTGMTASVVTITTTTAHNLAVGTKVTISGCTKTGANATNVAIATVPNSTTFTFKKTNSAVAASADTTGVVSVTAAVGGSTSINDLVTVLSAAINSNSINGYLSCPVGNLLYLSKVTTSSLDVPVNVTISPGAGLIVSAVATVGTSIGLSTYILSSPKTSVVSSQSHGVTYYKTVYGTTPQVTVIIGGATNAPYQYYWTLKTCTVNGKDSTNNPITIDAPTSASTTFSGKSAAINTYICTITDSTGAQFVTQPLTVTF